MASGDGARGDGRAARARALRGAGWALVALGLAALGYVGFQVWGTDVIAARHQASLRSEVARALAAADDPVVAGAAAPAAGDGWPAVRRAVAGGRERLPIPGDALGLLRIPDIGLEVAFVEGIGAGDLQRGPGHYPGTALPGSEGNVAIAGHRTTYGRPFWALDELEPGDRIYVRTVEGAFVYEVRWASVVAPDRLDLIAPTDEPSLTLTTCNPRFSSAERLVVRAVQVGGPGA